MVGVTIYLILITGKTYVGKAQYILWEPKYGIYLFKLKWNSTVYNGRQNKTPVFMYLLII